MKVNYRYKINWELGKFEIDRGYARYECIASSALVFMCFSSIVISTDALAYIILGHEEKNTMTFLSD